MANKDVRQYAKEHGVKLWQCAAAMGISEPTMTRRLRTELSRAEKNNMFKLIERLHEQNEIKKERQS